jgi:PAS domain S-box-containing protein
MNQKLKTAALALLRPHLAGTNAWLWFIPNATLVFFIFSMGALFWLLQRHELELQRNNLLRDSQWAEQTITRKLVADQDFLLGLAKDKAYGQLTEEEFDNRATQYLRQNPAMLDLIWNDPSLQARWSVPAAHSLQAVRRERAPFAEIERMARLTYNTARGTYTEVYTGYDDREYIEYHSPVLRNDRFQGTISAVYSLAGIIQHLLPPGFGDKYQVRIADREGREILAETRDEVTTENLTQSIPLAVPWRGLTLKLTSYKTASPLSQNMLTAMIAALSLLIVWSLWALRGHIRKRIEVESERDRFYNLSLDLVCIVGTDGVLKRVNPAFERILGHSSEALLSTPLIDFVHPDDRKASIAAMQKLQQSQQTIYFENRCRCADGSYKWLSWSANPVAGQGLIFAVANDISIAKQAELALKESHERFLTVLDSLDVSVFVADIDSNELLFVNERCRQTFPDCPVGSNVAVLEQDLDPRPCQRFPKDVLLADGQLPGPVSKTETRNAAAGRFFLMRARAIRWVDGRIVRVHTMGDVTEHRQAQEMARQQQEKLLLTSRLMAVGEMASTLAHELNQPLAAIANYNNGCVRRLQSGVYSDKDLLAAMEKSSAQAERAGKIIQRVRDFVRKREPQRHAANVNAIIGEVAQLAEIDAEKEGVQVRLDLAADLPPVSADSIMIEQVMLNLIKNAIEAMRDTDPEERELAIITHANGNGTIEIAVSDCGHGIPHEVEESLFSPFFTTKANGMGMGLNICRSIVEFHDGRLWFTPNHGRGSTFRFTLPVQN